MADNELNIITSDTNSVNVITEDNTLTITNDSDTTTVTLSAAETTTVQIAIAGPKGDKGEAGNIDASTLATTGSNTFNGNQIISGSLNITTGITGSLQGTASWAGNAVTASFAPNYVLTSTTSSMLQPYVLTSQTSSMTVATASYYSEKDPIFTAKSASFATTGSNNFIGNQIITGSLSITGSTAITGAVAGNVTALSIVSNTASINLSTGNYFTLQLVAGATTHINPTNIASGQTVNILVSTTGSATVSFPSNVKQPSGSSYVPTTSTGNDVITFVAFDNSNLYLAYVKNLL